MKSKVIYVDFTASDKKSNSPLYTFFTKILKKLTMRSDKNKSSNLKKVIKYKKSIS